MVACVSLVYFHYLTWNTTPDATVPMGTVTHVWSLPINTGGSIEAGEGGTLVCKGGLLIEQM